MGRCGIFSPSRSHSGILGDEDEEETMMMIYITLHTQYVAFDDTPSLDEYTNPETSTVSAIGSAKSPTS